VPSLLLWFLGLVLYMPGTTPGPEVGTTHRNHIEVIFALLRIAMAMIPPRRELKFTSKPPKVKFFF